jgi:hypothetical protein
VPTHGQALLIDLGQRHGVVERGRVLAVYIGAKGVVEASREDVDLVLLHQVITMCQQSQELALVFRYRSLTVELDQLPEGVATERRPESLVDELDEVRPGWLAMIPFKHCVPLSSIAGHVEDGEEDLPRTLVHTG